MLLVPGGSDVSLVSFTIVVAAPRIGELASAPDQEDVDVGVNNLGGMGFAYNSHF
jgi:hypothetical protein